MARQMNSMSISFKVNGTLRNVLNDSTGPSVNHPSFSFTKSGTALSNGINDEEANRAWQSQNRVILSGVSETLSLYDLAGVDIGAGVGLDGLGQAIVFEEVVMIAITNENDAGDAGALEVIPAAVQGWAPIGTHTVVTGGALYGQGLLIKQQLDGRGFDVADGVSHQITLTANGGNVTYSLYLLGRHDDEESSSSSNSSSSSSSSSSNSSTSSSGSSSSSSTSSSSSSSSSSATSSSSSSSISSLSSQSSNSSSSSSVTSSSSSTSSNSSSSSATSSPSSNSSNSSSSSSSVTSSSWSSQSSSSNSSSSSSSSGTSSSSVTSSSTSSSTDSSSSWSS